MEIPNYYNHIPLTEKTFLSNNIMSLMVTLVIRFSEMSLSDNLESSIITLSLQYYCKVLLGDNIKQPYFPKKKFIKLLNLFENGLFPSL